MSLEQCKHRGIESIDLNQILVLVKAPIESVAPAFSQSRQADIWKRDVCEREVEIVGQGFIVFQFRGHPWTLIYEVNFVPHLYAGARCLYSCTTAGCYSAKYFTAKRSRIPEFGL